jgi:two-component system, cell cycle response regulator
MTIREQLKIRLDEIGAPADVKALAAELGILALRDPLTGLYNRRFFDEALIRQTETALRYGRDLSLILFDLDNLKRINDTAGHPSGDQALKTFARTLSKTARKADIACRIGGDEFAVLLPETPSGAARKFTARFFQTLETAGVRASCGMSALPAENLFAAADSALLEAKKKKS